MVNWTLTNVETSETVELPINPESASLSYKAVVESLELPGDSPFVFALAKEAPTLRVTGLLYVAGQNKEYLWTNYVSKIRDMVMKVVRLSNAGSGYDGDWVLVDFSVDEQGGVPDQLRYTMEFIQGSEMITF